MSSRAIHSLLGEAMGKKTCCHGDEEKTNTFNFLHEIIYSCLYWALLKEGKKDRERKLLAGQNNMLL